MKLTLATSAVLFTLCSVASAQTAPGNTAGPGGEHRPHMNPECKAKIEQVCPGVQPGEGRIMECLKQHNTDIHKLCGGEHGPHAGNGGAPGRGPVAQAPGGQASPGTPTPNSSGANPFTP